MNQRFWKWGIAGLCLYFLLGYQTAGTRITQQTPEQKVVEVKGEVQQPGVYEVPWQATMNEILQAAGGCKEEGDLSSLNLTSIPANNDVIIVPLMPEQTCVSINSADAQQLDALPGIGPKIAERIIAERRNQPFQSLEEIKRVKGIGDRLYEKMKAQLCL